MAWHGMTTTSTTTTLTNAPCPAAVHSSTAPQQENAHTHTPRPSAMLPSAARYHTSNPPEPSTRSHSSLLRLCLLPAAAVGSGQWGAVRAC
jgi:hypothetical protein